MQLAGRRVLVTGASRGIGEALALGFRAAGADVAVVARPSDALDQTAAAVAGTAYGCDLADLDQVSGLVARVEADGPVDVLVNNAGISQVGWFLDRSTVELDQLLTVNLHAPVRLCREVLPGMLERGRGHVVNVSSMAAVIAPPGLAAYSASKAGLSHFTAGLRADFRDDPIGFTVAHLGSVKTDMDDEARSYGPLRTLAEQSRGRDVTPMPVLVEAVVRAVVEERPEVRVPRMLAPLAALSNASRVAGRMMFARVPTRD